MLRNTIVISKLLKCHSKAKRRILLYRVNYHIVAMEKIKTLQPNQRCALCVVMSYSIMDFLEVQMKEMEGGLEGCGERDIALAQLLSRIAVPTMRCLRKLVPHGAASGTWKNGG